MSLGKLFWSARWWRALLEGVAFCLVLVALQWVVLGRSDSTLVTEGAIVTVVLAASLTGLRARALAATWKRSIIPEFAVAGLLSLAVAVSAALGVGRVSNGAFSVLIVGVPLTGGIYLFWRIFRLGWDALARLRRKHFVWSLMFVFLLLISGFVFVGVFAVFALAQWGFGAGITPVTSGTWAQGIFREGVRVGFGLLIATPTALIPALFVAPPMALGAYLMSRRLSRRLTRLGETAHRLSQGDLGARVTPEGEDEIAQLQSDFNSMAEGLEKTTRDLVAERDRVAGLLKAQRELTASVSHELRTPLATAKALLESGLDHWQDQPPETLRKDLEVAHHELEQLQKLIADLFTLSKAEISKLELHMAPVDLAPLVERAVTAVARFAWNGQRVRVSSEVPDGLPAVLADETRVEQVLANLLNNGIRHTPPGGFVVVSADVEGERVRISVADTGEGITPEDLPHIWERFYHGKNGASEARTGLGLAIVAELAQSMGGEVGVESEPDAGSTFSVWLMRANQA